MSLQLRLARTIAADGVDVQAGADMVVVEHDGVLLSAVTVVTMSTPSIASATDELHGDVEAVAGEVRRALAARPRVDVVEPQRVDAEHGAEGERLELGLRAIADDRHGARARPGQRLGRHRQVAAVRSAVRMVISQSSIG